MLRDHLDRLERSAWVPRLALPEPKERIGEIVRGLVKRVFARMSFSILGAAREATGVSRHACRRVDAAEGPLRPRRWSF